eukprot:m.464012 g.464012  ORF g.464012 m.464012 type:complete len:269 (-) comp20355_c0_seq29:56-862(-)
MTAAKEHNKKQHQEDKAAAGTMPLSDAALAAKVLSEQDLTAEGITTELARLWQAENKRHPQGGTPTWSQRVRLGVGLPCGLGYGDPGSRWHFMDKEMSSNVAGEMGAVAIYVGALHALALRAALGFHDQPQMREFCKHHAETERGHLAMMQAVLPAANQTRGLGLCYVGGYLLGLMPTLLLGSTGLYSTVQDVETFVEGHYNRQISYLDSRGGYPKLRALLYGCCADEVDHKEQAAEALGRIRGPLRSLWRCIVTFGCSSAAEMARWL